MTAETSCVCDPALVAARLEEARRRVLEGIRGHARRVTSKRLRNLLLDYPLRPAKALRPALMFAAAEAFGAAAESVLPTAVALELCHNAFLLHDDVEDRSARRRHGRTLHLDHGAPVAINVGDGMFALALEPLLENTQVLGLGRALRILQLFAGMSRVTVAGQHLELDWIQRGRWDISRLDYVRMIYRKTAHYTFVTPIAVGAIVGGVAPGPRLRLSLAAARLGIAFQIADDILSVAGNPAAVGKDDLGDLYEGKRTLILIEALARATPRQRNDALSVLRKNGPGPSQPELAEFCSRHGLSTDARRELVGLLGVASGRDDADVVVLRTIIEETRAASFAREYALALVARARAGLAEMLPDHRSPAARFLLDAGPFALSRIS